MLIKNITITNSRGESITFGHRFRIADDFDMSGLNASVNYSESTADGSNYQNTKLENREFDIPFFIHKTMNESWWIEEQRNLAYRVFNPKCNPFRIDITTKANAGYYINANIEGSPIFPLGFENDNSSWQKGLLQFSANDPYIYKKDAKRIDVALWVPNFEFPLEIPVAGVEMGYRSPNLIANVINDGQESTGMTIRFKALGTLSNPSLLNVNTYETLKVNIALSGGDIVEVSTHKRRKYVKLIRGGVESNIFNLLDLSSTFLQLNVGDNLFGFDATAGLENLDISMAFTPRLLGV